MLFWMQQAVLVMLNLRLLNSTECVNLSRMSSTINQQQTICLHSSTAKYVHPICPGVKIRDRNADWSEIRDRNAQGRQTRERSTELIKSREINAEWSETIDRNVERSIPNRGVNVTTQHENRNEESALVDRGSTADLGTFSVGGKLLELICDSGNRTAGSE
ncbi:uncharacterized protein LOC107778998 isoform X2 [Nicotiana tabacum]|uniref:Uncharacterized protein LOC107778998 isoform X2 n=1 Tax=Nicotiana tabacum TaxID=4097 RepID=A0A1S3YRZ3_TOBAC|nr:PREDICTED: uncharacterized protein LOC107778998 isoform X2 [Nicotiana tabacum]